MAPFCKLSVVGIPRPAGSKSSAPYLREIPRLPNRGEAMSAAKWAVFLREELRLGVRVFDDNRHVKKWQAACRAAARILRLPVPEPGWLYDVEFAFYMPRLKSHFRKDGSLRPDAPVYPGVRPDVLKLARAVEDALTGVIWADDAAIVDERLRKRYGSRPGVVLVVNRFREGGVLSADDPVRMGMEGSYDVFPKAGSNYRDPAAWAGAGRSQ